MGTTHETSSRSEARIRKIPGSPLSYPPKSQSRQTVTNCLHVYLVSLPENRFTANISFFLLKPSTSFTAWHFPTHPWTQVYQGWKTIPRLNGGNWSMELNASRKEKEQVDIESGDPFLQMPVDADQNCSM